MSVFNSVHVFVGGRTSCKRTMMLIVLMIQIVMMLRFVESALVVQQTEATTNNMAQQDEKRNQRDRSRTVQKNDDDSTLSQVLANQFYSQHLDAPSRTLAGNNSGNNFKELNDIITNAVITLPDSTMSQNGLSLTLTQLTCNNLYVENIQVLTATTTDYTSYSSSTQSSSSSDVVVLNVEVSIQGLNMDCTSRYSYNGWIFSGRGDATVSSYNNRGVVSATITLLQQQQQQQQYSQSNPTTTLVNILACYPSINVQNLDFHQNGIMGWVLDRAEPLLRNIFENRIETKLCSSIENFLQTTVNEEWLQNIILKNLNQYNPSSQLVVDPLRIEKELIAMIEEAEGKEEEEEEEDVDSLRLLDLQDPQTKFGQSVQLALDSVVSYVNKPVLEDWNNSGIGNVGGYHHNDDDGDDLQINALLREWMLEPGSNALVLDQYDMFSSSSSSSSPPFSTTRASTTSAASSVTKTKLNNNFVGDSNVLYEGSNSIVDVTIKLDRISLKGLDSLRTFDPLEVIGLYTLRNSLVWEYLTFDVDLILSIQPSTSSDSIIDIINKDDNNNDESSSSGVVEEKITLQWSIEDIHAVVSIVLGINQTSLESIQLGTLLQSASNILPCLLSTVYTMELSTLFVSATNIIKTPTMTGFISPGLDALITSTLDGTFSLFENLILDASPAFFQQEILEILQSNLIDKYKIEAATCQLYTNNKSGNDDDDDDAVNVDNIVDWRDLLLSPTEAKQAGGTGMSPYGDVMSSLVMPALKDQILTNHEQLNEKIIRTFTREQSGIEGTLAFPSLILYQYIDGGKTATGIIPESAHSKSPFSPLWNRFEFKVSNVRIHNIDTISTPVSLLEPMANNILLNKIKLDSSSYQQQEDLFGVTVTVLLAIEGKDNDISSGEEDRGTEYSTSSYNMLKSSSLYPTVDMYNELDITFSIPSTSMELDFIANLDANALMEFPLLDVTNIHCWLAAISPNHSPSSVSGTIEATGNPNLALTAFSMIMSSFKIDASCVSCSSPGGKYVSEVLNGLYRLGCYTLFNPRLTTLLEEVIWGFSNEFPTNDVLQVAPKHCKRHQEIHPNVMEGDSHADSSWPIMNIPNLSPDGVETILALGLATIYSSMMVIAKNHLDMPTSPELLGVGDIDFLPDDAFPKFDSPPTDDLSTVNGTNDGTIVLVDWSDLSSTFGGWADAAFEEFRQYLHDVVPVKAPRDGIGGDSKRRRTAEGEEELRFNQLLRTHVLHGDGDLSIDLNGVELQGPGFNLLVSQVRVFGLDTVSNMDILNVVGPTKIVNDILLDRIDVVLDVEVFLAEVEQPRSMTLSYALRDLYAEFDFYLALDMIRLGNVELGSILDMSNIFICVMSGAHNLSVSKLKLVTGKIETPGVGQYFSSELHHSLTSILEALFDEYRDDLIAATPIIFDTSLRDSINTLIPDWLRSLEERCTYKPVDDIRGKFIDFRDLFLSEDASVLLGGVGNSPYGNLFRTLYNKVDQEVLVDGASLNDVIGEWTQSLSNVTGLIEVPDGHLEGNASLSLAGLQAEMVFKVSGLSIRNLNSIGEPLELATPVMNKANVLNNTVSFGVGDNPLQVEATVMLSIDDGKEIHIRNEVKVSLEIDSASVLASLLLKISEPEFLSFPLRDLTNSNCWLATILSSDSGDIRKRLGGIALLDHTISIANITLDVRCVSCTSPRFDDLLNSLYSPSDIEGTTNIIHDKTEQVYDGEFLEALLDRLVLDAARQCPHRDEYDPNASFAEFLRDPAGSLGFAEKTQRDCKSVYFNIANTVFVVGLFVFGVMWRWLAHRRTIRWVDSLSSEGAYLLGKQQAKEREKAAMLNATTTSLFRSRGIPKRVRVAVPCAIFLNAVLYLIGHLGVLSTVDIDATLAGDAFTVRKFLEFSFIDSTRSTYNNGGSEMVILIWMFTGVWPYIKMILSLLAWMLPPSRLSVYRRGQILLWIDAMAKLSVVDVFTMILGFAMLLVYFGGPDKSITNQDALYTMKAIVTPGVACYCIIIAQRMARVSSRYFLQYHQQVIDISVSEHELKIHRMHSLQRYPDDIEQTNLDRESEEGNNHEVSVGQSMDRDDQSENYLPERLSIRSTSNDQRQCCYEPMTQNSESLNAFDNSPDVESKDEGCSTQLYQSVESLEDRECSSGGDRCSEIGNDFAADPWSCFSPDNISARRDDDCNSEDSGVSSQNERDEDFRWGSMGVFFAAVSVIAIFVIACAYAPAVSLDTSDVFVFTLESDHTFQETVPEYGVFAVASYVLLKARFVLDTTSDYIGLGFFLLVGFLAIGMTFLFQLYQFSRTRREQRRQGLPVTKLCHWPFGTKRNTKTNKEYDLPYYLSMHKWKHMEIYLISVSIGVWQLGSIAVYAIHLYCDILSRSYEVLAYVGLVEYSNAQCFRIQAKLPGNLLIIGLSFCILVISFIFEVSTQLRNNIKDAKSLIREEDAEHLSMVWHPEKHDGIPPKYTSSRLDATFLMDQSYDDEDDVKSKLGIPRTPLSAIHRTSTFESTGTTQSSSTKASTQKSSSSEGVGVHAFDEFGSFL